MTEQKFWEIIELSWADSPKLEKQRAKALKSNDEEILEELSFTLFGLKALLSIGGDSFRAFSRQFRVPQNSANSR